MVYFLDFNENHFTIIYFLQKNQIIWKLLFKIDITDS